MLAVCFECGKEMKVAKVGMRVSQYNPTDTHIRCQNGDLFQCENCGIRVIAGLGGSYDYHGNDRDRILFVGDFE